LAPRASLDRLVENDVTLGWEAQNKTTRSYGSAENPHRESQLL